MHFKLLATSGFTTHMEKYSWNLSVPRFIPKEEIIKRERKRIQKFKDSDAWKEWNEDPEGYMKKYGYDEDHSHIKYLKEEFPKMLEWSDEEVYQYAIRYEEEENIQEDGSVFEDINPNAKWDWYVIGGRYSDSLILKPEVQEEFGGLEYVDAALKKDLDLERMKKEGFSTFAILTPEGEWKEVETYDREEGKIHRMDEKEWDKIVFDFLESLPEDETVVVIDCHE